MKRTALRRVARVLAVQRIQSHVGVREYGGRNRRSFTADPWNDGRVADPESKQLAYEPCKRDDVWCNACGNETCKPCPKGAQEARRHRSIVNLERK